MSLDNNYPSSNLSPDPTTSALGGNHYLLDLGSSFDIGLAASLNKTSEVLSQDLGKLQAASFKQRALDKITIL
jgi:hypothetical protein